MPTLCLSHHYKSVRGFPGGSVVKNLRANAGEAGDTSSIPRLGRSHGEGNGNPLQYSCLENSMDRGAWWATIHGITEESDTTEQLRTHLHTQLYLHQHPHSLKKMRIKQTADHSVREQNSNSILLTPNTCSFPLSTRSPDLDKKDIGSIQTPDSCWRFERWIISNWLGNSWVVQWLRLHASIAEGTGSNPGMGTKILNAAKHKQTKTKKERNIHTHTHTHIYIFPVANLKNLTVWWECKTNKSSRWTLLLTHPTPQPISISPALLLLSQSKTKPKFTLHLVPCSFSPLPFDPILTPTHLSPTKSQRKHSSEKILSFSSTE